MKKLYAAIGIDCDPDRDSYPEKLTFRGIENISLLHEIENVKWTFNIRADSQIRNFFGSADYCYRNYRGIWDDALEKGSALALHLHYFGQDWSQNTDEQNIIDNVDMGTKALDGPDIVHMGWTFQNQFSIRKLYDSGIRIDYSPLPRMKYAGRNTTDAYDWSEFAYRPNIWKGVKMIPSYTYKDRLLGWRFGTDRVMLTICTHPILYRRLLKSFFETGSDFFVTYFHIDEIISALSDWRSNLYSLKNLKANIRNIRVLAERNGYEVEFLNMRELAGVLFDEYHPGNA